MRPYKYTQQGEKVTFHYKFSELRNFLTLGKRDGNVGVLILGSIGNVIKYKGFGTIENPRNVLYTIRMTHYEPFDGPYDPEKIVNPPPRVDVLQSHKMYFINMDTGKAEPYERT